MRNVSLNDKLHLVIPIVSDTDDEHVIGYVHSAPIARETFELHFELLSMAFSAMFADGQNLLGGPRIASLMLRKIATKRGEQSEYLDLMNEVRRLSNVVKRGPHGWVSQPLQEAIDHQTLTDDEIAGVTNAIAFFIVASAMLPKSKVKPLMDGVAPMWGARNSYLDFTAFVASLGTSTGDAHTTKAPTQASSVVF